VTHFASPGVPLDAPVPPGSATANDVLLKEQLQTVKT